MAASELFGHVKGAFTGATADKKGSFEQANNGTLFLDEIGNLSYENQVKLLRVLQERKIRRVGSEKETPINVRIIVATNEDLRISMEKGNFREDIYYRINEFKILLHPLRKNAEELEDFIRFFLQQSNQMLSKSVKGLSKEVLELFKKYPWPGNIRELKNTINQAVLFADGKQIEISDLPSEITNETNWKMNKNNPVDVVQGLTLNEVTEKAETRAILNALNTARQNKSKAAKILGIDRKTLYNKMNAYGLEQI